MKTRVKRIAFICICAALAVACPLPGKLIREIAVAGWPLWRTIAMAFSVAGALLCANGITLPRLSKPADDLQEIDSQTRAGGAFARSVMHDLNNALMVASSYCELLMDARTPDDRRHNCAAKAQAAVLEAAHLAKQMRSPSPPDCQSQSPEPLDVDQFISDLVPHLAGASGSQSLKFQPGAARSQVFIDRSRLGQLIEQAIRMVCDGQESCSLEVHTGLLHAQGAQALSRLPRQAGDYAWISIARGESPVTNTGEGIHLQEVPYSELDNLYTTPVVVKECGGEIAIDRGNNGAAVIFYFPCSDRKTGAAHA